MTQPAVELDQQAVLLVEHIDLGAATGRLPMAHRQAVGALDQPEEVQLQRAAGSGRDIEGQLLEQATVSQEAPG